ncbi:MAG: phosphatase PAP2 family protein [Clostridium sp.]|nr:phosphatase PAP2 family protein [Clostridium sp.]
METLKNENIKNTVTRALNFLDNNYTILLAIVLFVGVLPVYFSGNNAGTKITVSLYWFAAATAFPDRRKDVRWTTFLILMIPFILFVNYIEANGYTIWGKILHMQIASHISVIDLNPIFKKIPFNDGAFARIYKNQTLTWFMRLVYNNGFVVTAVIPIYRSAICKDLKKTLRYMLSAHVLQIFLISPFYIVFHLQEVWYVLGQPDGLDRHLTGAAAAGWTLNCFPSMHTSISFAMFLLVLREKDKIFKCVWGFFCLSVIYSTLYLEIHWVIDIIAGLILAYVTVKLADFILAKVDKLIEKYKKYYYRNSESSFFD